MLPASVIQQELPVSPVRDKRRKEEYSLGDEIMRGSRAAGRQGGPPACHQRDGTAQPQAWRRVPRARLLVNV